MATHSSTLAWRIPWREEPGRLQSMGSQRVGHDWVTSLSLFTFWSKSSSMSSKLKDCYKSESKVSQSCSTLCGPMGCRLPDSSVHGIFQAKVVEWVAISFFRGSSLSRDWTQVSLTTGRLFTVWTTGEAISQKNLPIKFVTTWDVSLICWPWSLNGIAWDQCWNV